ncbi:MAG TPA: GNAT family N-acetyltransferase [Burkholderiaceae bacterium]
MTTSSPNIALRRLAPTDAAACRALRLRGLQESPTAFGSSYTEESALPLAATEAYLAPDSGRSMFGAFDGDTLVAIAGIGRESRINLRHKAFLRSVYTAPEYRGRRIAQRLIAFALQFADALPDVRQVTLTVNAGNSAALAVYEALGFASYGREPDALLIDGTCHDELLMVRFAASKPDLA